jgi:ectoine hydroxylase-related dioxygenase (phytanoyl-CoA dioxygenase family)
MIQAEMRRQLREEGFCVVRDALSANDLARVRSALAHALERLGQAGIPTHDARLDPNAANLRVYNLPEHDRVFLELLRWPAARELVEEVLGPKVIVSNFTANIAMPGSGSMTLHSDQALVIPPPWDQPWAMNVIWCLDDVYADNGATRYLPGSHLYRTFEDVPANSQSRMLPFEAPAGSLIAMEGRIWHTSGSNVTADKQRRLLFAYYSMDFIRQQVNWEATLSPETKASLDDDDRRLLGLGPSGNTRIASANIQLRRT